MTPSFIIGAIFFSISLFILIKSSQYFTDAAEKIGIFFKIPPFVIGVTIVAFGTSLPELVSSIFAVFQNSTEIIIGTVVGSNITNILLVLGITSVVSRKVVKITYELIHVDLPLLIASSFLLAAMAWDGVFSFFEGVIALIGIILYLHFAINSRKEHEKYTKPEKIKKWDWKNLGVFIISAFFIYLGAKYTIDSVIQLSSILQIGKELVAVSVVAFGTSLPELTVSIAAIRKGRPEMAIGNVLGSNIFNSLVVMGIPALIVPLIVPSSIIEFSLPIMIIASLLYFFTTQDKQMTKWEGGFLLLFYIFFIWKLFV